MQWYYAKAGQAEGPLSEIDFQRRVRSGEVHNDTLVWHEGLVNWTAFGQLPANGMGHVKPRLRLAVLPSEDTCSQCGSIHPQAQLVDHAGAKLCPKCLAGTAAAQPAETAAPERVGTTPNRNLMAQARARLRGHWGLAAAAMLVACLLALAVSFVPMAGSVLVAGPLGLGLAAFFLTAARGDVPQFGLLFAGFQQFVPAFLTGLLLWLLRIVWLLPAFLVLLVGSGQWLRVALQSIQQHTPPTAPPNWGVFALGMLLAVIGNVWFELRYSMTYFSLAENTEAGALAALGASSAMMRGHYWKLLCLYLRFTGWILLGLLVSIPTCGVGAVGFLWLVPYIQTTQARFYDDIHG
jgi:uncharacterized membrane protein